MKDKKGLFLREDKEKLEEENLAKEATKANDFDFKANRWLEESRDIYRTSFQRDIDRILYSNPLRRLRTKTQIFHDPNSQHNRTRLTHTMEVSNLSRQVARTLKLNVDLTEAIALGHDLGHTPFGHAGERALNEIMSDEGGFSHNAQSVWLVEKVYQGKNINGKPISGLNLTYAVREGILKHTDVETNFEEYDRFHPKDPPTLEGQVVNLCDSLAYLHHDIDDGIRNDFITQKEIKEIWESKTDYDFSNWYHYMISDLVENSYGNEEISFSKEMKEVYQELNNLIKNKIIKSDEVQKSDKRGKQMIFEMYDLLSNYPRLIPDNKINRKKKDDHGMKRVIIDFIQWLGDHNFEEILTRYKEAVKRK